MSAIAASKLMFRYREGWVISGIDLVVRENESIALIGPNGSGKTTLLRLLSGILRPEQGEVLVHGVPIGRLGRRELSKRMALVSQEGSGQFPFTVMDVVLMGRTPYLSGFQMERAGDIEKARWAMEVTELTHLSDRAVGELSGGERQRTFIARALCQDTRNTLPGRADGIPRYRPPGLPPDAHTGIEPEVPKDYRLGDARH